MISSMAWICVSLLPNLAAAIPWAGPVPTPAGLMAMAGMSPRPTDAPGFKGIPQELRRRNLPFPPPDNWCGFISGDSSEKGIASFLSHLLTMVQMLFSAADRHTPVPFMVRPLVVVLPLTELATLFTPHATITMTIAMHHACGMSRLGDGNSNSYINPLLDPQ